MMTETTTSSSLSAVGSARLGAVTPPPSPSAGESVGVRKRQRRLSDMDAMVLSLFAKGLTTGGIAAYVVEGMSIWMNRLLERIYAAIVIGHPRALST